MRSAGATADFRAIAPLAREAESSRAYAQTSFAEPILKVLPVSFEIT
jgi:hypothetical protein